MTERGARSLQRDKDTLTIGPSSVRFDGASLIFNIDEKTSRWSSPIRGEVRATPRALLDRHYRLDSAGRHRWWPLAPMARIEVDLHSPAMRWSGDAYCDSNEGDEPLERGIESWHWMRGTIDRDAVVIYDVRDRRASESVFALRFARDGSVDAIRPPALCRLNSSKWLLPRATRSDTHASIVETLDDTPFYVRSIVNTQLCGRELICVHESLSLNRFASPIVQAMLPFRLRRKA